MTPAQAARAAIKLDKDRKVLIEYLQGLDFDVVKAAGASVRLPRFATKLHHYTGDVSTSMLMKVTGALADE